MRGIQNISHYLSSGTIKGLNVFMQAWMALIIAFRLDMNLFVISLLLSLMLANDRLSILLASFVSMSDSNMAISWVMPFGYRARYPDP